MTNKIIKIIDETELSQDEQSLTPWISNHYIKAATSQNTRKAYRSDIQHFEASGGRLPATPEAIASYLHAFAAQLNPRTLSRRLTAIKHWHIYQGFPDPTKHPAIQKTLAGIMRVHGRPKEKAYPLAVDDLRLMAKLLVSEDTFVAHRDNALIQTGFFGAFRRSELTQIRYEHIEWKEEGIDILVPQSKTDQTHEGQFCAIPYGKNILCPVTTLKKWLDISGIQSGPVFRKIQKSGALSEAFLTPVSVNYILKKRAEACGIAYADQLSSHSLRRGLATSASMLGVNLAAIMRQGRWKQVSTVMEYIEASERFKQNAAMQILESIDS